MWTDKVRQSTGKVSKLATHVSINHHALRTLSETFNASEQEQQHPLIPRDDLVNWVLTIDLINFSFWPDHGKTFEVYYQGQAYRGYWAMCALIKLLLDKNIRITDPREWNEKDKVTKWFLSITDYIPMLEERVDILFQAHTALSQADFDVESLLIREDSVNETLSALINAFESLRYRSLLIMQRDWCEYRGERVYFLKRAQIMVADWYTMLPGRFPKWRMGELTMFADYRVPAILHSKGVLEYSTELEGMIERGDLLEAGCEMEVEIRAASVQAVEELARLTSIPAYQVDFLLWDAHPVPTKPHHRTRTIFY